MVLVRVLGGRLREIRGVSFTLVNNNVSLRLMPIFKSPSLGAWLLCWLLQPHPLTSVHG